MAMTMKNIFLAKIIDNIMNIHSVNKGRPDKKT